MIFPEFDESSHKYLVNGREVPFVSGVLKQAGLVNFPEAALPFLENAGNRGRMVHKACDLLDCNNLDWNSLNEEVVPYVRAYERFLNEHTPSWDLSEASLYSEELGVAGTVDRAGEILYVEGIDSTCVLDIKTASRIYPHYWVQLSGYNLLCDSVFGSGTHARRGLLVLKLNKDERYKLIPIDPEVRERKHKAFIGACWLYNEKLAERII